MKTFSFLSIVFALLSFTACVRSNAIDRKISGMAEAFQTRPVGASSKEFLSGESFKSLTVEIQYMAGYKPQQETVYNLSRFLNTYLNKPDGIHIIFRELNRATEKEISKEDALKIEKENRSQSVSPGRITIYLLFTNGTHPSEKILGMAYQNTSSVIYGKAIRNNSSPKGVLTVPELETTVLLHEVGHLLGLGNKESISSRNHADRENDFHCDNKLCLMYYGSETTNLPRILKRGYIPVLDKDCENDLLMNGGKKPE
jgi:hypothetical protein